MPYSFNVQADDIANASNEQFSQEEEQQAAFIVFAQLMKYAQVNFFQDSSALGAFDKAVKGFSDKPEGSSNDMIQAAITYFDNNFDTLLKTFAKELGIDPAAINGIFPQDLVKQSFIAKVEEFAFVYNASGLGQRAAKNQRAPIRIKA